MTQIPVNPGNYGDGMLEITTSLDGICLHANNPATAEQIAVLMEALVKYVERNVKYRDNWKRMGWRGVLVRVRERSERLWDSLWNHEYGLTDSYLPASDGKLDDAIDLINFAAFLVRAVRAGNRDGSWWEGM